MTRSVVMATQTFPPRVGGMEMVMFSLAQYISKLGTPTYVVADRRWMETASFHFTSIWAPKILRSWAKRIYLTHHFGVSDIYVCDSWKSIISLPKRAKHIIMLAHGQEYLNKQNKRPEIQRALDRCRHYLQLSRNKKTFIRLSVSKMEWANQRHTAYLYA